MSNAATYDHSMHSITTLAAGHEDVPVGACPGWSVKDLVAHLASGLRAFHERKFGDSDQQVLDRRSGTLADAVAEWTENRALIEPLFDTPTGSVLVTEVVMHEHDLRTAVGEPGERDTVAVRSALTRPLQELDKRMREQDIPALRIALEHGDRVLGAGEPVGTLRGSSFEVLRAIGGRRSEAQIRAMDWDGDPAIWLPVLALFGSHREEDFAE